MAWTFASPCTQPGCRALVRGGGRCKDHREEPAKRTPGKGRPYDTALWDRLRALVLAEEPYCRICWSKGEDAASEQVDHIVPIARGGPEFERANLQALCHGCHSLKTRREQLTNSQGGARGARRRASEGEG